jgi:hypothetical protein
MKENTINLILLLTAVVIIMAIIVNSYDNVEFSVASLGLNVKANRDSAIFVNLPLLAKELERVS